MVQKNLILLGITLLAASGVFLSLNKVSSEPIIPSQKELDSQIQGSTLEPLLYENQGCPPPKYKNDSSFIQLIEKINKTSQSQTERLETLSFTVRESSEPLNTTQILRIISQFTFQTAKYEALQAINPYIDGFKTEGLIQVVTQFNNYTCLKFEVLKLLVPNVEDLNATTKIQIKQIFDSGIQTEVGTFLDQVKTKNCVYGLITEKVVLFIIDVSGSMDQKFTFNGTSQSRLNFVKTQVIDTIQKQLTSEQKLNIFKFSDSTYSWSNGYLNATTTNVQSAVNYVKGLSASGGTQISNALNFAFTNTYADTPNLEAIYLLSDGEPSGGITTATGISDFLKQKNQARAKKVKVNTVSFMQGGSESQTSRNNAELFLQAIANSTGGVYKRFQ